VNGPRARQVLAGTVALAVLGGAWALTRDDAPASVVPPIQATPEVTTTLTPAPAPLPSVPEPLDPVLAGGLRFTDASQASGVAAPHARGEPEGNAVMAAGAAVGDYDDDGDLDLYLTRLGLPNRLLRNDGGARFDDVAEEAGVAGPARGGDGAPLFADVDGDSDLDLLVTSATHGGTLLFVNDGDGRFTEEAARRGLALPPPASEEVGSAMFGAAFGDIDRDGDLDLVALQWFAAPVSAQQRDDQDVAGIAPDRPNDQGPSLCELAADRRAGTEAPTSGTSRARLWTNDGDGTFTDATAGSGVAFDQVVGFQPRFADVDGDGWPDLLLTGDFCTSRLYRNDRDGTFTDITDAAGVGTDENGMGSVVEDLDGDGHLDWFVTGIRYATEPGGCPIVAPSVACSGNRLFLGDGSGAFTDATDDHGVRDGAWGWGATGDDLNNDGRRDLLTVNGYRDRDLDGADVAMEPNLPLYDHVDGDRSRLWLGGVDRPWPEGAQAVGIDDERNAKAVVAFDADGDGDLDLLVANTGDDALLYRNDTPTGDGRHWLRIRLRDPDGTNTFAIGARVAVDLGDGAPPLVGLVRADGSFQSGDPTDVHLGLGSVARAARVTVTWPDGAVQQLVDIAADQVLLVERPAR
jgi:hypothetical protein